MYHAPPSLSHPSHPTSILLDPPPHGGGGVLNGDTHPPRMLENPRTPKCPTPKGMGGGGYNLMKVS